MRKIAYLQRQNMIIFSPAVGLACHLSAALLP